MKCKYKLIWHYTRWPWNHGPNQANINNYHYTHNHTQNLHHLGYPTWNNIFDGAFHALTWCGEIQLAYYFLELTSTNILNNKAMNKIKKNRNIPYKNLRIPSPAGSVGRHSNLTNDCHEVSSVKANPNNFRCLLSPSVCCPCFIPLCLSGGFEVCPPFLCLVTVVIVRL